MALLVRILKGGNGHLLNMVIPQLSVSISNYICIVANNINLSVAMKNSPKNNVSFKSVFRWQKGNGKL